MTFVMRKESIRLFLRPVGNSESTHPQQLLARDIIFNKSVAIFRTLSVFQVFIRQIDGHTEKLIPHMGDVLLQILQIDIYYPLPIQLLLRTPFQFQVEGLLVTPAINLIA